MATWSFEPGHTEAAFCARHMMVTWVRGLFKDVHGRMAWVAAGSSCLRSSKIWAAGLYEWPYGAATTTDTPCASIRAVA